MKWFLFALFLSGISISLNAQVSVAYHQSNLSFMEVTYEVNERWVPSARIGTNLQLENFVLELAGLYQFKDAGTYEAYAGGGIRLGYGLTFNDNVYIVLPVGLNVFPFESKGFGFHMEIAPMLGNESLLRGSFGIRYRFEKE